jgi:molybdopterin molybdotransferase
MKSFDETLAMLLSAARGQARRPTIALDLADSLGRIAAQPVTSAIDVPAYDNSQMDGYAGRVTEMNLSSDPLPVSQRIPAGHPGLPLAPGTVARIFTGAPIPQGANAVIMQEQAVVSEDGRVRFTVPAEPGQNIRPRAGDIKQGQMVVQAGRRLTAADLGLCASIGVGRLTVVEPLTVGVFSSGDEIRQPGETLAPGQIYDSNRPMILGLAKSLGCRVIDLGCLPDHAAVTREKLSQAATSCDLIITCGGVSVGEEDHIKAAVSELGSLDLWKIAIKPGKPFAFGHIDQAVFMGLPGNPVAAWVTFVMLVRPYILAACGVTHTDPQSAHLPADFDWPKPDARQEYLRGWVNARGCLEIHARQNSGVLSSVTECEGLIEIPAGTPHSRGKLLRFIPYSALV